MADAALVLGPLLRYVDQTEASVWVETARAGLVTVTRDGRSWSAPTFRVHDHHYALVGLDRLEAGSRAPYTVDVDGERAWPPPDSPFPVPVISTLSPGQTLRIAYGSCRTSVAHDEAGHRTHGVDALRTYALRMADRCPPDDDSPELDDLRWPDLVLFLGDQVYADETTQEMREFIEARRDIDEPPGTELQDYEEYAHLYRLAWSDPANRWLLATVPSAMIFDDHDVRDDWNTSLSWRRAMEATSWWHGRIVGALSSYWVYQHLGNLSAAARDDDEIWRRVAAHDGPDELDLSDVLDAFADRVDQQPDTYRWSFSRDFGEQARLVVVDSRAARVLDPDRRALLDPAELEWLDARMRGDVDHLLVGTSLPFLLAPGLHHVEAFNEALAGGAWGARGARWGERLRRLLDLEHWAAFQDTFSKVAEMTIEVAAGRRGRPPADVVFLSGDVHHSYVNRARLARRRARRGPRLRSEVLQAVCSPIRNPLSRNMRFLTAAASYGVAGPIGRVVGRSAKVPDPPLRWKYVEGPWFDNNLALLEIDGRSLRMRWFTGNVRDGDHQRPRLSVVADHHVGPDVARSDG